jgi:hypothetical protein
MGEQNLHRFKAESGTGELMRGSFCEGRVNQADGIRSHPQRELVDDVAQWRDAVKFPA